MELTLKYLKLKNFKGIKKLELEPDGKDLNIFGNNGSGKTTIFDAFTWLLFDKDSKGNSQFDIKTLNEDGEVIHNLDHEVEGILDIDGKELKLKKVYYEKWTKSRGSTKESLSGHTTDYYINEVPVKKKEYDNKINEIVDEKVFKLVTNPAYFNEQLHWTDRREILLEVCGNVSDEEVIEHNSDLDKLKEIISEREIGDHRSIIKEKMKNINEEIEKIPTRIDEVNEGLEDVADLDKEEIKSEIKVLEKKKQEKQDELARIKNGGEVAEKKRKLSELETEINDLEREYKSEYMDKIDKKEAEIKELEDEVKDIESSIKDKKQELKRANEAVEHCNNKIEELKKEWFEVNEKEFDESKFEFVQCPECGNEFPLEDLEEKKAKFNQQKAEKLEKINAQGKEKQKERDQAKEKIDKLESEIDKLESQRLEIITSKIDKKEEELKDIREEMKNADTFKLNKLRKQKRSIKETIEELQEDKEDDLEDIREEIAEYNNKIKDLQANLSDIKQYEKGKKRIKELEEEQEKLAAKYEELEEELYLTEEFTKTKVNLLESKINEKFEMAKFKLFDKLVNGGIDTTCETLYKGVPYSSGLNNGAQINIGLDIIRTLSEYYDFKAPIFIDNAESVVDILDIKTQMIKLVVSPNDNKLRIEKVNTNKEESDNE